MKKRLLSLLAVLALAGCAAWGGGTQAACPDTGFLADAAVAPLFPEGVSTPGPADVGVYAVLRKMQGGCTLKKDGEAVAFSFDVVAQKTALAQGLPEQKFSYFIAIIDKDETILQRQRFYVTVDFGKNDSGVRTVEHEVKMPAGDAATGRILGQKIVVGFTLTPEQVAFNKAFPHDLAKGADRQQGKP